MNTPVLKLVGGKEAAPAFPQDYNHEKWIADLRGKIWHLYISGGMTFERMAEETRLNIVTVTNFAWGDTRRPASNTTFELSKLVGFPFPDLSEGDSAHLTAQELRLRRWSRSSRRAKQRPRSY